MLSEKLSKLNDNISGKPNHFLEIVGSETLARFESFSAQAGKVFAQPVLPVTDKSMPQPAPWSNLLFRASLSAEQCYKLFSTKPKSRGFF